MMDTKAIESCVENLINSNSNGVFPSFAGDNDAINHFMYNTAKRLTIYFEKFMSGRASKDVFLCSLRNYLLVFQNEMDVPEGLIPPENEYGILRNAEQKYFPPQEVTENSKVAGNSPAGRSKLERHHSRRLSERSGRNWMPQSESET